MRILIPLVVALGFVGCSQVQVQDAQITKRIEQLETKITALDAELGSFKTNYYRRELESLELLARMNTSVEDAIAMHGTNTSNEFYREKERKALEFLRSK